MKAVGWFVAGVALVVIVQGRAVADDGRAVRALERIATALEHGACH